MVWVCLANGIADAAVLLQVPSLIRGGNPQFEIQSTRWRMSRITCRTHHTESDATQCWCILSYIEGNIRVRKIFLYNSREKCMLMTNVEFPRFLYSLEIPKNAGNRCKIVTDRCRIVVTKLVQTPWLMIHDYGGNTDLTAIKANVSRKNIDNTWYSVIPKILFSLKLTEEMILFNYLNSLWHVKKTS